MEMVQQEIGLFESKGKRFFPDRDDREMAVKRTQDWRNRMDAKWGSHELKSMGSGLLEDDDVMFGGGADRCPDGAPKGRVDPSTIDIGRLKADAHGYIKIRKGELRDLVVSELIAMAKDYDGMFSRSKLNEQSDKDALISSCRSVGFLSFDEFLFRLNKIEQARLGKLGGGGG